MKKSNIILFVLFFVIVGELVVRFDKAVDPLNNAPHIIAVETEETELKKAVDSGEFEPKDEQYRILVVGDSYIHGGGIDPEKKTSKMLYENLTSQPGFNKEVLILDVSRPSNNSLDNFNTFEHYNSSFKPNAVVWGYNINDILGDLVIKEKTEEDKKGKTPPAIKKTEVSGFKYFTKLIFDSSELFDYLFSVFQKELKLQGIVLPFGYFHHFTKVAYEPNSKNWKDTQAIFYKSAELCKENEAKLIIYKMPEFNLLKVNSLFVNMDNSLNQFFEGKPQFDYYDGYKDFDGVNEEDYMLSKYDGHPNVAAHQKIADRITSIILED